MKKPKLTPEEKAEIKKEIKAWNEFIIRLKSKQALISES